MTRLTSSYSQPTTRLLIFACLVIIGSFFLLLSFKYLLGGVEASSFPMNESMDEHPFTDDLNTVTSVYILHILNCEPHIYKRVSVRQSVVHWSICCVSPSVCRSIHDILNCWSTKTWELGGQWQDDEWLIVCIQTCKQHVVQNTSKYHHQNRQMTAYISSLTKIGSPPTFISNNNEVQSTYF